MSGHVGRHTSVLLDGYALLKDFQDERRRAQEANQGAKTCTAPRPREYYDDRVQAWLRQVKDLLDSIDSTELLWNRFSQAPIPTRYADPNKDVQPLGDYCHRLPVLLEALDTLLNKKSERGTDSDSPLSSFEDPIKCVWIVKQIGNTAGRSDTLANKMKRKRYRVVKVAGANYCERRDAIAMFPHFKQRLIVKN